MKILMNLIVIALVEFGVSMRYSKLLLKITIK